MDTYHLSLAATHKSGYVEHDFCVVKATSREEAIAKQTTILNNRMAKPLPGPAGYVCPYSKWESFKLS